jgi:hypothetical protein
VSVLLLAVLIYRMAGPLQSGDRRLFLAGMCARMCGGIALGLLYTFYYEGDTFTYFNSAVALSRLLGEDPPGYVGFLIRAQVEGMAPRASFFVKCISPLVFLSGDNYWIVSLWLSVLAFLGAWYLVRRLRAHWPSHGRSASIVFLFLPSVVLWGSGIIKESLATGALFFLAGLMVGFLHTRRLSAVEILIGIASAFLLWNLKYYYAAVFLTAVVPLLAVKLASERVRLPAAVVWVSALAVTLLLAAVSHPNFYPEHFLTVIVDNHEAFAGLSEPGGYVRYRDLDAFWMSVAANAPLALISGLFRPFAWEAVNVFSFLAGAENLLILLLSLAGIAGLARWRKEDRVWILSALFYCCVLAVFLALSTPNFGTLVRYKVGFVPFLVYLSAAGAKPLLSKWKIL